VRISFDPVQMAVSTGLGQGDAHTTKQRITALWESFFFSHHAFPRPSLLVPISRPFPPLRLQLEPQRHQRLGGHNNVITAVVAVLVFAALAARNKRGGKPARAA